MRRIRFRDGSERTLSGEWTADGIETEDEVYSPDAVTILPPTDPTKIVGVGPTFYSTIEYYDRVVPETPGDLLLFTKTVPNSVVGHGDTATLRQPGEFHYEAEIGAVIGERCRDVPADEAMEYVEGLTCVNEITNKGVPESRFDDGNHVRSKAFDDSAPFGPVVASPDRVPEDATLELRLNGETRQKDTRDNMVFSIPTILSEVSKFITLVSGDVVATGSPEGVDRLSDGDEVEVEIEGVGTLRHSVEIP